MSDPRREHWKVPFLGISLIPRVPKVGYDIAKRYLLELMIWRMNEIPNRCNDIGLRVIQRITLIFLPPIVTSVWYFIHSYVSWTRLLHFYQDAITQPLLQPLLIQLLFQRELRRETATGSTRAVAFKKRLRIIHLSYQCILLGASLRDAPFSTILIAKMDNPETLVT